MHRGMPEWFGPAGSIGRCILVGTPSKAADSSLPIYHRSLRTIWHPQYFIRPLRGRDSRAGCRHVLGNIPGSSFFSNLLFWQPTFDFSKRHMILSPRTAISIFKYISFIKITNKRNCSRRQGLFFFKKHDQPAGQKKEKAILKVIQASRPIARTPDPEFGPGGQIEQIAILYKVYFIINIII
jgi:hypothetical protein